MGTLKPRMSGIDPLGPGSPKGGCHMERLYGRWLLYLRFATGGREQVLHVLCDTREQLDRVLATAAGPASGIVLIEHAAWSSQQMIYTRLAEGVPDRHILTYDGFVAMFGEPAGGGT